MSIKHAVLVLCFCVGGIIFFYLSTSENLSIQKNQSAFAIKKSAFEKLVTSVGPSNAYAEFKEANASNPNTAHTDAHIVGDVLYEYFTNKEDSLAGLAVCDSSFGYGCYHQYVSRVLISQGVESLPALAKICDAGHPSGCMHGLGHGLLEYFGTKHVTQALEACELTSSTSKNTACRGGVFMDYNVPLATSSLTTLPRTLTDTNKYSPCDVDTTPEEYAHTCYGSLPHWWFQIPTTTTAAVGKWCSSAPQKYRQSCFLGIGIDLPGRENYVPSRIIAECDTMPDKESRGWCLASSAHSGSLVLNSCDLFDSLGISKDMCEVRQERSY